MFDTFLIPCIVRGNNTSGAEKIKIDIIIVNIILKDINYISELKRYFETFFEVWGSGEAQMIKKFYKISWFYRVAFLDEILLETIQALTFNSRYYH